MRLLALFLAVFCVSVEARLIQTDNFADSHQPAALIVDDTYPCGITEDQIIPSAPTGRPATNIPADTQCTEHVIADGVTLTIEPNAQYNSTSGRLLSAGGVCTDGQGGPCPYPLETIAFPGAEGWGAETLGARGSPGVTPQIVFVDNLNNSGPGSFRAAIEDVDAPRYVIFRVSGTLFLNNRIRADETTDSFVTIAGQTAPGDGVTVANYPIQWRDGVSQVIMRHMRFRLLDSTFSCPKILMCDVVEADNCQTPTCNTECCVDYGTMDAMSIGPQVTDFIFDHNSFTWSVDEAGQVWDASQRITVQWNILGEGSEIGHVETNHNFGPLIGGVTPNVRVSFHHNYLMHGRDRQPKITGAIDSIEVINNIIYNAEETELTQKFAEMQVDYYGNYYKVGPSLATQPDGKGWSIYTCDQFNPVPVERLYIDGNRAVRADGQPTNYYDAQDPWSVVRSNTCGYNVYHPVRRLAPLALQPKIRVTAQVAEDARDDIVAGVGATCPIRDSVDTRLVNEFETGTGAYGVTDVFPTHTPGTYPPDADNDAMPDAWETARGLNPNDASDAHTDRDHDGFPNIEEYLNELAEC